MSEQQDTKRKKSRYQKNAELWREIKAQREFEVQACRLTQELEAGTVGLEYLNLRVQLLELLVEQTGGTILMEHYREMLCDLKKGVALETERRRKRTRHLAAVRAL